MPRAEGEEASTEIDRTASILVLLFFLKETKQQNTQMHMHENIFF